MRVSTHLCEIPQSSKNDFSRNRLAFDIFDAISRVGLTRATVDSAPHDESVLHAEGVLRASCMSGT
jgi:hypothetical protein